MLQTQTGRPLYYQLDPQGQPVPFDTNQSVTEWNNYIEDERVRSLHRTDVTPEVTVRTIFLGVDMDVNIQADPAGPPPAPKLFSTLVVKNGVPGEQKLWSTRTQADEGHEEVVKAVRKTEGLEDLERLMDGRRDSAWRF
jgi:hypothetical protein